MNYTVLLNILALLFLALAAWVDRNEFRLPNLLLAAAALALVGAKLLVAADTADWTPGWNHLLGLSVWGLLVAVKLFAKLRLGAGDLKLLGVGVLAAGYLSLVAMLLCALVWALAWLALRSNPKGQSRWKGVRIPLGPGLAAGVLVAFLLQPGQLAAQEPSPEPTIDTLEFRDQSLPDIVRALGAASGQVLVVDETVDGRTSWYFPKGKLSDALAGFLVRNHLYLRPEAGVKEVTRVNLTVLSDGSVTCDAEDVGLEAFFKVASRRAGKTVLLPPVPPSRVTVRGFRGSFEELLQVAGALVPDYQLKKFPQYFTFVRRDQPVSNLTPGAPGVRLTRSGNLWSAEVSRTAFADVVRSLAAEAGFEYSFVYRPDAVIDDARFANKTLDELLDLLGQLAGADSLVRDGIRYFTQRNQRDVLQDLKATEVVTLKYLNVTDASNLLPPDLAGGGLYRSDKANNAFVLNGSGSQIETFKKFLASIDKPLEGRRWVRFDLTRQRVKDVVAKFPQGTGPLAEALVLGEQNSLLVPVSEAGEPSVRKFIAELDQSLPLQILTLKYLKAEDLLKRLPPTILKDELVDGGGSLVLFAGPKERFDQIKTDITLVDMPRPQIRYQLLVIDYQKGESLSLSTSHKVGMGEGSNNAVGQLAGALKLSLDVVSNFGLTFASSLSLKLERSKARVMADTTLQGLSGQDLKFQNTTTVRYVDTQIDPVTGKETTTGVTRDLSSGLILALNGWVSGDGIITVSVTATISKLGDAGTSSRPTTSERVLSTQVRTPSGVPLIIGGLQQRNDQDARSGLPWLTDIPLLGSLFDNRDDAKDATELTIYIVPFVDYGLDPVAETNRFLDDSRHRLANRLEAAWSRENRGEP